MTITMNQIKEELFSLNAKKLGIEVTDTNSIFSQFSVYGLNVYLEVFLDDNTSYIEEAVVNIYRDEKCVYAYGGSFEKTIIELKIQLISNIYKLDNPTEIKEFLLSNPLLLLPIINLDREIYCKFNNHIPTLKLVKDQYSPDLETLLVSIYSIFDFDISYPKLELLLQDFAFNQSEDFKRLITISVD